ncbi:hypothetical protein, partial [Acinetobacter baumannii]|uniref:hypothetical protein n=1 Tax=Acinetobacter baumannii TaxID=470 RepID=UPI003397F620
LHETLKATWKKAGEVLKKARARQVKYYNRHAKDRELQVGDQVLLLLPSGTNKLDIAWRGPYRVTAKKSKTVYQVEVNGRARYHHINLLKKYTDRPQTCFFQPSSSHSPKKAITEVER